MGALLWMFDSHQDNFKENRMPFPNRLFLNTDDKSRLSHANLIVYFKSAPDDCTKLDTMSQTPS